MENFVETLHAKCKTIFVTEYDALWCYSHRTWANARCNDDEKCHYCLDRPEFYGGIIPNDGDIEPED